MKQIWFKQFGWVYLPIHAGGIFVTLLAIVFLARFIWPLYEMVIQ